MNGTQKTLSVLLSAAMALSLLTVGAWAEEEPVTAVDLAALGALEESVEPVTIEEPAESGIVEKAEKPSEADTVESEAEQEATKLLIPSFGNVGESAKWQYYFGSLTVSGSGAVPGFDEDNRPPWYSFITRGITSAVVEPTITGLSAGSLYRLKGLESVTLPFIGETAEDMDHPFCHVFGFESGWGTELYQHWYDRNAGTLRQRLYYIPPYLETVTITGGDVPAYAFENCDSLTTVNLPATTTAIRENAFYNCTALTSVTIPEGAVSIGKYAFYNCTALAEIAIPASVTQIDPDAFWKADNITKVTFGGTVEQWIDLECKKFEPSAISFGGKTTYKDFGKCGDGLYWYLTTGNALVITGSGAMWDYENSETPWADYVENIRTITLPEGLTTIGNDAFYGCKRVTAVDIPAAVTAIGERSFYGCSALKELVIPANVTNIGKCAFSHCSALKELVIPTNVTNIGDGAFSSCTSLSAIEVAEGNTAYAGVDGVLFSLDGTTLVCCPAGKTGTYTMPESVTALAPYAFLYCAGLTEVVFSPHITEIPVNCFGVCSGLEKLELPEGLKVIEPLAFAGCAGLRSIVIPDGVTTLRDYCFLNVPDCPVETITIPASVTEIGDMVLYLFGSLQDVYYGGSQNQWKAIAIGKDNPFDRAVIHYATGDVMASGSCGDALTWSLSRDGVLTIDGEGDMTSTPWREHYRTDIVAVNIGTGVTSVAEKAFYACYSLKAVTLHSGLTLGDQAFSNLNSVLSHMVFVGTEAQWNAMNLGTGNGILKNTRTICFGQAGDGFTLVKKHLYTALCCPVCGEMVELSRTPAENFDVNGDGNVNSGDLVCLMKYVVGAPNDAVKTDLDGSGSTNVSDVIRLLDVLAELAMGG